MIRPLPLLALATTLASSWWHPLSAQTGTNGFAQRPTLAPTAGVAVGTGDTTTATAELNEPDHVGDPARKSIWWKWTAASTGVVEVNTIGSDFFTRLAVYMDAPTLLGLGSAVAANLQSDATPNLDSELRFVAVGGTTYSIAVDGEFFPGNGTADFGTVRLTVRQPAQGTAPGNDRFASATALASLDTVTASGDTTNAAVEHFEPDPEITGIPSGPARTVWFSWVAPATGYYNLSIEAPAIGGWAPAAAVYTGASLETLVLVDKAENLSFEPVSYDSGLLDATFRAVAGQTYLIQVAALSYITSFGPFDLGIAPALRPENDDFPNATDLGTATTAAVQGTLLHSTSEAGEPDHFFNAEIEPPRSSASLWWKWTAPTSTGITVDTRGSDGDTLLVVYQGTALNALSLVDFSDDINFAAVCYSSAVTFTPIVGQTYYFVVTGYSQGSRIRLHLSSGPRPPPYQAWLLDYPGLTGPAAAREADADEDGLPNLTELMLGTDPTVPSHTDSADAERLGRIAIEDGVMYLDIGFSLDNLNGLSDGTGTGGLPIIVEGQLSTDLVTWATLSSEEFVQNPNSAFLGAVVVPGQSNFLRVNVEDPNPSP